MKALKKIVLSILFIVGFLSTHAQGTTQSIGNAFSSGNVSGITRYFDKAVSMSVLGSQSTYSRSQAEMVLKDFFNKNAAKGFVVEHSGGSDGNSYAIGTLHTASGQYRTYFAVREKEGSFVIQEIRIER